MTAVIEIDSKLSTFDLYSEFQQIQQSGSLQPWVEPNATNICINTTESADPSDVRLGGMSLDFDWDRAEEIDGKIILPKREVPLLEKDFTVLCTQFRGTLFETVYNELKNEYNIGRVRIMTSKPKTCLSWHYDSSHRIHYPMKTQEGCFMLFESQHYHLAENKWYYTYTDKYHTALNSSFETRTHLVACVI